MQAGVIGLGQMGRGIAANLHRAGLLAAAWDVSEPARTLAGLPAEIPLDLAAAMAAEAVVFVVPSSREIRSVLDTLLATPQDSQILIDLTTSSPKDTCISARRAASSGRIYLDGGMSGGAMGADSGNLTLMMGGPEAALERVHHVLGAIARNVFRVGDSGAGHTMKLVHNMVCHTNFLALAEACRIAERAGLALPTVIDVINAGNARSYVSEARFPNHILSGRFDGRSTVANLAKDLGMAAELADQLEQDAPYTRLTASLLGRAVESGHAEDDFTRLYPLYEALAGLQGE